MVNQKNNRNTSGNARLVGVIVLAFQGILFASSSAQRLDVSLVEEYAIGDDPGREAPYLLGGPQSISVNSLGNFYLADYPRREILRYGADGRFLGRIGRRGSGPGEFREITCMVVDDNDDLVVVDKLNARITRIDASGSNIEYYSLPTIAANSPGSIVSLGGGEYALYYLDRTAPGRDVLHVYNADFSEKLASFGALSDIWDLREKFYRNIAGNPRGVNVASDASGNVYLAPYVYGGSIYRFSTVEGGWGRTTLA